MITIIKYESAFAYVKSMYIYIYKLSLVPMIVGIFTAQIQSNDLPKVDLMLLC